MWKRSPANLWTELWTFVNSPLMDKAMFDTDEAVFAVTLLLLDAVVRLLLFIVFLNLSLDLHSKTPSVL